MSSCQIFKIVRAPEAEPITEQQLKHWLFSERKDSEWCVDEMILLPEGLKRMDIHEAELAKAQASTEREVQQ